MEPTTAQQEKAERLYEREEMGAAKTRAFIKDLKKPGPHPSDCVCHGNGWVHEGQGGVRLVCRSFTGAAVYHCPKEPAA